MGYGEACRGDVALLKQRNPANLAGRGDVALLKQGNLVTLAGRGVEFKETIRTCLIQTGAKLSLSLILALESQSQRWQGCERELSRCERVAQIHERKAGLEAGLGAGGCGLGAADSGVCPLWGRAIMLWSCALHKPCFFMSNHFAKRSPPTASKAARR